VAIEKTNVSILDHLWTKTTYCSKKLEHFTIAKKVFLILKCFSFLDHQYEPCCLSAVGLESKQPRLRLTSIFRHSWPRHIRFRPADGTDFPEQPDEIRDWQSGSTPRLCKVRSNPVSGLVLHLIQIWNWSNGNEFESHPILDFKAMPGSIRVPVLDSLKKYKKCRWPNVAYQKPLEKF